MTKQVSINNEGSGLVDIDRGTEGAEETAEYGEISRGLRFDPARTMKEVLFF